MHKTKSFAKMLVVALLAVVTALALFTACSKPKHAVTFEYDKEIVTVTAEGYDELPTELEEGSTLTINITVKTGYTIGSVPGAKLSEGTKYLVTVGKADVKVKINYAKIPTGIEVKLVDENKVYFMDQAVAPEDIVVTAKFEAGEDEVVDNYTISYQAHQTVVNGEPQFDDNGKPVMDTPGSLFREGDTGFTVTWKTFSREVTLQKPVSADILTLKVATFSLTAEGKPCLTVTGEINPEAMTSDAAEAKAVVEEFFNNCTERNSWSAVDFTKDATVDVATGTFEIKLVITGEVRVPYHYYFHIGSGVDGRDLGADCVLTNETCLPGASNDPPFSDTVFTGEPIKASDGTEYYVGKCMDWGSHAIMIVVMDEETRTAMKLMSTVAVNLKADNAENPTKAYYVVTAVFDNGVADKIKTITFGNVDDSVYLAQTKDPEDLGDGYWRMWFEITEFEGVSRTEGLWANLYIGEDHSALGSIKITTHVKDMKLVLGNTVFYIIHTSAADKGDGPNTYDMPNLFVKEKEDEVNDKDAIDPSKFAEVKPEASAAWEVTDVAMEATTDKVYYVVSGTYTGYAENVMQEQLGQIYFDYQQAGGSWTTYVVGTAEQVKDRVVTVTNGTFTVKFDVTNMPYGKYTTHYKDKSTNFTLDKEGIDGKNVELNGIKYSLMNKPGSSAQGDCYGTVALVVELAEEIPTMTYTNVELVVDGEKLYYVLTVNFTAADADDAKITAWIASITIDGGRTVAKNEKVADKQYKLSFDITDLGTGTFYPHMFYKNAPHDGASGDVKFGEADKAKITGTTEFGGKTYTLTERYDMPTVDVAAPAAAE